MRFRRLEIPTARLRSLAWDGDSLVDWIGGHRYPLGSPAERFHVGDTYRFNMAVGSGGVGASFEALGTKGVLLRDNGARSTGNFVPMSVDVIRELNRSYYQADAYLFPLTLFEHAERGTIVAHCPRGYNVLDFEQLDGTCLTPRDTAGAEDIFHSELQASPNGKWLLSNGWVWHPCRVACVFDVERALREPSYLSTDGEKVELGESWSGEVEAATFVGDRLVCATSEERPAITIYDLQHRRHEALIELPEPVGNRMMGLGDDHIVLLGGSPRILQISSGAVIERWDDIDVGNSAAQYPSVSATEPGPPYVAIDPANERFALGWPDRIVVILRDR